MGILLACSCMTAGVVEQIDEQTKYDLVKLAAEMRQKAYAPYSNYYVGAALLAKDGSVFLGTNVENASYGLTCCAERAAIFKAVSEGVTDFSAIAVSAIGGGAPCGACRQVMNEFQPTMIVLLGDENGNLVDETTLDALLPRAFGPANLHQ